MKASSRPTKVVQLIEKAPMANKRLHHSACAQLGRFLIVSGTRQSEQHSANLQNGGAFSDSASTVGRYDSVEDRWEALPCLNVGRYRHSSCATATSIFVFCGQNRNAEKISSIEVLSSDRDAEEDQEGNRWRLINAPILGERMLAAVAVLGNDEGGAIGCRIAVMGGNDAIWNSLSDCFVLDTRDETISKVELEVDATSAR